jgi:hypothetical protein
MSSRWIRFRWSDGFKGDPHLLGERAGLVVRRDGDALKATTVDQYHRSSQPQLLKLEHTVNETNRHDARWRQSLERWHGAAEPGDGLAPRVDREVRRLLHHDDDDPPSTEEYFEAARLLFMCLPDQDFPTWVADTCVPTIAASMPNYRLCLVSYDDQIHTRMAYVRALFSAQHAVEWFAPDAPEQQFGALQGLGGQGFQGTTRFIDPLLGAHAPWMFGTGLSRFRSGYAVVLFGAVLPGRLRILDSDLLDTLATHHLTGDIQVRAPRTPTIAVEDAEAAVRWWTHGLNRLMGHVLDPTLFADQAGWYQPHQHLGQILSVERLFASIVSILVHTGRDEYTRRMHLFEAFDLLDGLSLGGYDRTVDPKLLQEHLDRLKETMPDGPAKVLLPRCERAVDALREFRERFHPGRLTDQSVNVTGKDGQARVLSKDKATSSFIRVVRNAGHGFRREIEKPASLSLLTAHDGSLPAAISDLPYLHLLRLIAEPDLIGGRQLRHPAA